MVTTYRPESLCEALEIRAKTNAIPFAGGTDLMVKYRKPAGALPALPAPIVFIGHLKELTGIEKIDGFIKIGAGTTLSVIEQTDITPVLLREAAAEMAAPAIKNIATIGGNIGNASPAGDTICPLIALNASLELASINGLRKVCLLDFITGPGKNILAENEIITSIYIPDIKHNLEMYRKVGTRKANALSKISFAGTASLNNKIIKDLTIAFGAVAPTVVRSFEIEKTLEGLPAEDIAAKIDDVISEYDKLITPIDDQRSDALYRKTVALNLLQQFLKMLQNNI